MGVKLKKILILFILNIYFIEGKSLSDENVTYAHLLASLKYPDKLMLEYSNSDPTFQNNETQQQDRPVLLPFIFIKEESSGISKYSDINTTVNPIEEHLNFYQILSPEIYFLIDNRVDQNYTREISVPSTASEMLELLLDKSIEKYARVVWVFKFDHGPEIFEDEDKFEEIKLKAEFLYTFKQKWEHVKIGFYGKLDFYPHFKNIIDALVIEAEIGVDSVLSYQEFYYTLIFWQKELANIFVKFKCEVFIKLKMEDFAYRAADPPLTKQEKNKLNHLLLKSSLTWINSGENLGIILNGFTKKLASIPLFANSSMKDFVMPSNLAWAENDFPKKACAFQSYLETVSSIFSNILQDAHTDWPGIMSTDKCILNPQSDNCSQHRSDTAVCLRPEMEHHNTLQWILDGIYIQPNEPTPSVNLQKKHFLTKLERLPLKSLVFNIFETWDHFKLGSKILLSPPSDLDNISKLFQNVSFGCTLTPYVVPAENDNFENFKSICEPYWNYTDFLLWFKVIGFRTVSTDLINTVRYSSETLSTLVNVKNKATLYPNKKVLLRLLVDHKSGYGSFSTFYCDSETLKFNELGEVIINFARVFNFQIAFKPAFGGEGWWQPLKTINELAELTNVNPSFTKRNYPAHPLLPGTIVSDPCVQFTQEVLKDGITFNRDFSGTTFYFDVTNHTYEELEESLHNMFLLIENKMLLVELFPRTKSSLLFLLRYLRKFNNVFSKILTICQPDCLQLYLRVECDFFLEDDFKDFKKQLNKIANIGIHLANWDKKVTDKLIEVLDINTTALGMSLDNCTQDVLNQFNNVSRFQYFSNVSYLICNITTAETIQSSNLVPMQVQKYLDSTLYVQKYFQKLFPNDRKQILFRLNHDPYPNRYTRTKSSLKDLEKSQLNYENLTAEHFLKFIGDVNQFSEKNKIKLLMFPAFDTENGEKYGWWKITDFKSLSNSSVFVEKEAEYLGKETWRPTKPSLVSNTTIQNILIWGGVVLGTLLLLAALVFQYLRIRKYSYLSKNQVDLFFKGINYTQISKEDDTIIENLGFSKQFEIQKKQILLLSILGHGNFGLIYRGQLSLSKTNFTSSDPSKNQDNIVVAVKMPLPGCPKDSFMSLLSEIKVLCYIGTHPNILRFVGAYVKDIGRGDVYIVTDFCQNGSLLDYLKNLQVAISTPKNEANDDKTNCKISQNLNHYELARFSHEICQGMDYLGNKKVIHGDLSARNILLDANITCKIADFGLSRKLYEYDQYIKKGEEPLPWRWMALESLKLKEFTTWSDIWSFGVTCWEIYSLGCTPYPCQGFNEAFLNFLDNGQRLAKPEYATDDIYETMNKCWTKAPNERPEFSELSGFFVSLRDSNYSKVNTDSSLPISSNINTTLV